MALVFNTRRSGKSRSNLGADRMQYQLNFQRIAPRGIEDEDVLDTSRACATMTLLLVVLAAGTNAMPSTGGGASPSTSPCCWLFCWSGNHIRTRACTWPSSPTPPTPGAAPATPAPTPLSSASLALPPKWLLTSALPPYGFTVNTGTVLLLESVIDPADSGNT
ncbi:hypothetical protein B0H14DRAFT_2574929 [Mycena olivaceomarginata]|nr:hypothetical protein B0H14DRAFT_2574929 [Mycena olivaceomarginata]